MDADIERVVNAYAQAARPPIPVRCANRPTVGGVVPDFSVLDQLAARSQADGDCLVWMGARTPKGYGHVRIRRKTTIVHRAAWIARYGPPPQDKPHVLHRCDNPPCWKDDHLWVGTDADNAADRDTKGRNGYSSRTHCPQGHEYTHENTYITGQGRRKCWTCLRQRELADRPRRKIARAARARAAREALAKPCPECGEVMLPKYGEGAKAFARRRCCSLSCAAIKRAREKRERDAAQRMEVA